VAPARIINFLSGEDTLRLAAEFFISNICCFDAIKYNSGMTICKLFIEGVAPWGGYWGYGGFVPP
jgi:hypothetical protein